MFPERGETKLDLANYYVAVGDALMRTVARPPDAAAALPERGDGPELLPEADPRQRARLAGDDDRRDGQRHRVAGDRDGRPGPRAVGGQPGRARLPPVAVPRRAIRTTSTSCASTSTRRPASTSRWCARRRPRCATSSTELGITAFPKTTGNRGLHVYVRVEPGWDSYGIRQAAISVAREMERRRPDLITGAVVEGASAASASSSTSTRTPRTRRCSGRGACAPASAPRSRRRSAGTSCRRSTPTMLTMATVPARLAARRRPVGWHGRRAAGDRAARRALPRRPRQRDPRRAVAAGVPEDARRGPSREPEPRSSRLDPANLQGSPKPPLVDPAGGRRGPCGDPAASVTIL